MSSFQKRRFSMVYPMVNTDVFIIFQYIIILMECVDLDG